VTLAQIITQGAFYFGGLFIGFLAGRSTKRADVPQAFLDRINTLDAQLKARTAELEKVTKANTPKP